VRLTRSLSTCLTLLDCPQDCFNRPLTSAPDRVIDVLTRTPIDKQKCGALHPAACTIAFTGLRQPVFCARRVAATSCQRSLCLAHV